MADILGDRGEQIDKLLVHANTLLAAVNERGRAVCALLLQDESVHSPLQVQGLIDDNPRNLDHVLLEQLRIVGRHPRPSTKNDLASVLMHNRQVRSPALSGTNASGSSS